jgi:tRNA dimethylallyltransferase
LDWETDQLDARLATRTEHMFDAGLVDEVADLLDRDLRDGVTASRALGYAQVIAALDDPDRDAALARAREQTFVATRRYVRRQRSWFRRDHRICWLDGADPGTVLATMRARRHVS